MVKVESGIIFVNLYNPITEKILLLTGQNFSHIGFYYTTHISGKDEIHIMICDIFLNEWTTFYFEDLLSLPNLNKIICMNIKKNYKTNGEENRTETDKKLKEFKKAILSMVMTNPDRKMTEWIKEIFDFSVLNTKSKGKSIFCCINDLIKNICNIHDCFDGRKYQTTFLYPDYFEKSEVLFEQTTSYTNEDYSNKLIDEITKAIKELMLNNDFLDFAANKFKNDDVSGKIKHILDLVHHIKTNENIIETVVDSIKTGKLDIDNFKKEIGIVIKDNNKLNEELKIEKSIDFAEFLTSDDYGIILLDKKGENNFSRELTGLRDEMDIMLKDIAVRKTPTISLSKVIHHINSLINFTNVDVKSLDEIPDEMSITSIVSTGSMQNEKLLIDFDDYEKYITLYNPNFDNFNLNELKQILNVADSISTGEDIFDEFRTELTKKISQMV